MDIIPLFMIGVTIVWFWYNSMQIRESATNICKATCRHYGVQLLDHTVALHRLGLRWQQPQGICLSRIYNFEISEDGTNRRMGSIIMCGQNCELISLPRPINPKTTGEKPDASNKNAI